MKICASALAVSLLLAATTLSGHEPEGKPKSSYDGSFMQKMVMHHEMGAPMVEMCSTKATHAELKELCVKDLAAQKLEVAKMKSWMESSGSAVTPKDHDSGKTRNSDPDMKRSEDMKHAGRGGMKKSGMMGPMMMKKMEQQEDYLRQSSGADFEKDFLKIMSEHHQSAVAMARPCTTRAQKAELKQLCSDIVKNQTSAIKQMNIWRSQWYGSSRTSSK